MDGYATSTHKYVMGITVLVFALSTVSLGRSADEQVDYGIGRPMSEQEIRAWNIDVSPNGDGLPPGQGTVKHGAQVYAGKCAACHGPTGTEGPKDKLVGGQNTLKTPKPVRTIGSYWPYATTLYDYINRAMPYNAPQSLTPDEVVLGHRLASVSESGHRGRCSDRRADATEGADAESGRLCIRPTTRCSLAWRGAENGTVGQNGSGNAHKPSRRSHPSTPRPHSVISPARGFTMAFFFFFPIVPRSDVDTADTPLNQGDLAFMFTFPK